MDTTMVSHFIDQYSQMTDEDLSYLVVTRGEYLSEEAQEALQTVLKSRNPEAIQREVDVTAAELSAQAEHTEREAKRHETYARTIRSATRWAYILIFAIGVLTFLFASVDVGAMTCVIAFALFLFVELRRLAWRFVAALFRSN